jgi:hypothetical protein
VHARYLCHSLQVRTASEPTATSPRTVSGHSANTTNIASMAQTQNGCVADAAAAVSTMWRYVAAGSPRHRTAYANAASCILKTCDVSPVEDTA